MTAEALIFKTKEEELQASQAFNKLQMGRRGAGGGSKAFLPFFCQLFHFEELLLSSSPLSVGICVSNVYKIKCKRIYRCVSGEGDFKDNGVFALQVSKARV